MAPLADTGLPPVSPHLAKVIESCDELPLLDLHDFIAGKPGAVEQLAADIRAIHQNLGFMAVVNHGIDQAIIDKAAEQVKQAFNMPEDELEKCRKQDHMQGYWGANSVRIIRPGYENNPTHNSSVAGWTVLRDRTADDPKVVNNVRHRAMNRWPSKDVMPEFRLAVKAYEAAMLDLGMKLIKAYSLALGQSIDYLDNDFEGSEWYNRLNYFRGSNNQASTMGLTAHSDHSFITLLPISPTPGLEVRNPRDEWLQVAYQSGVIIVNGGEWLNQISNGHFMATPHRVSEPTEERVSMPFFFNPNDEAMNDPVPGSVAEGEERTYPAKNFYEHFIGFIDAYTKA